jgi:Ca2+/Na+ antiporter
VLLLLLLLFYCCCVVWNHTIVKRKKQTNKHKTKTQNNLINIELKWLWVWNFENLNFLDFLSCRIASNPTWFQHGYKEIREIRIRIYLPFWPDKFMRDLHCWEWQQSSILALFSLSLIHGHKDMLLDTQVCFGVPPVYTPCTTLLKNTHTHRHTHTHSQTHTHTSLTFTLLLGWIYTIYTILSSIFSWWPEED